MTYLVEIRTTDAKGVGAVALSIFGSVSHLEKIALKENKSKKQAFEKGSVDEFELKAVDVGEV